MTDIERAFEALALRVSREAAAIECDPSDYQDGLTTIIETLRVDRRASEETNFTDFPEDDREGGLDG